MPDIEISGSENKKTAHETNHDPETIKE